MSKLKSNASWVIIRQVSAVAGDLMLFELIVLRVHYIECMVYVLDVKCAFVWTLYI